MTRKSMLYKSMRNACKLGKLEKVKELVESGFDVNDAEVKALFLASYCGKFEVVKYLVENGADIYSDRCLYWANYRGHLEIVNYLKNRMLLEKLKAV